MSRAIPFFQLKFNDDVGSSTIQENMRTTTGAIYTQYGGIIADGRVGNCLSMYGNAPIGEIVARVPTTSYLNLLGSTITRYAISIWIRPTGIQSSTARIFEKPATPYPMVLRASVSNALIFALFDGTNNPTKTTSGSLTINQWYHAVINVDRVAKTITMYINNVQNGSAVTDTTVGNINNSSDLIFGNVLTSLAREYMGDIDDMRIFDYNLSTAEINFLYNNRNGTERFMKLGSSPTMFGGLYKATHKKEAVISSRR